MSSTEDSRLSAPDAPSILRSRFLSFAIENLESVDLGALLRGTIQASTRRSFVAESPAAFGRKSSLDVKELELLLAISCDDWESVDAACARLDAAPRQLERLVARGVLLSNQDHDDHHAWLACESRLRASGWSRAAAQLHFVEAAAAEGSGATLAKVSEDPKAQREAYAHYIESNGPPPPAFYRVPGASTVDLQSASPNNALEALLQQRTTTRTFADESRLSRAQLAQVLQGTFGCRGVTRMTDRDSPVDARVIKRSAPSGGSMHSVEPFVLALRVEDVEPGLYHYDVHASALRTAGATSDAISDLPAFATRLCAGQPWAGDAHALVFLVARFDRGFWKYPNRGRAYSVVLMDAGHLSQTFYLLATQLGLGVFYSAALDTLAVDRYLGLSSGQQGTVGALGIGHRAARDPLSLDREPA